MGSDIEIRKYAPTDKAAALNLIRLNTPQFFAPAETEEFGRYLDMYPETYYMLLLDGKIAGGGGVFFAEDGNAASLAWGMIHPAHRRKGLGTALTRFRLEKIDAERHDEKAERQEKTTREDLSRASAGTLPLRFFRLHRNALRPPFPPVKNKSSAENFRRAGTPLPRKKKAPSGERSRGGAFRPRLSFCGKITPT